MISGDLQFRQKRFEKEQRQEILRSKQKQQVDTISKQKAKQQQEDFLEKQRLKRLLIQQQKDKEEQERLQSEVANNGVYYKETFKAYQLDEKNLQQKGIRRYKDKVQLSQSVGQYLYDSGAAKNGTYVFEIKKRKQNTQHAYKYSDIKIAQERYDPDNISKGSDDSEDQDVLSQDQNQNKRQLMGSQDEPKVYGAPLAFDGRFGEIGLPKYLSEKLFPDQENFDGEEVDVEYIRLSKGSFAVLQPQSNSFFKDIGDQAQSVLEATLLKYTMLSKDQVFNVEFNDKEYSVKVLGLEPEDVVIIVDTELEVDIDYSMEYKEHMQKQQDVNHRLKQQLQRQKEKRLQKQQVTQQGNGMKPVNNSNSINHTNRFQQQHQQKQEQQQQQTQIPFQDQKQTSQSLQQEQMCKSHQPTEQQQQNQFSTSSLQLQGQDKVGMDQEMYSSEVPEDSQQAYVTCMFKLPQGQQLQKRFLLTDHTKDMYQFLESQIIDCNQQKIKLFRSYPRQLLVRDSRALLQIGFQQGKELLIVEKE